MSTVGPDGKVRYALKRVRVLAIPAERLDDSEFLDRILSLDLRPHQLARALQGDRPRSR